MKIKPGLKLRKIGSSYMIVDACTGDYGYTDVYTLNATAATIWTALEGGASAPSEIAAALCAEYYIDHERALSDVLATLDQWQQMGIVE